MLARSSGSCLSDDISLYDILRYKLFADYESRFAWCSLVYFSSSLCLFSLLLLLLLYLYCWCRSIGNEWNWDVQEQRITISREISNGGCDDLILVRSRICPISLSTTKPKPHFRFSLSMRRPPLERDALSPPIESERNEELSRLYHNSFRLSLFSSPFLSFFLMTRIATQIHKKSKRYDETIRRIAIVVVDNENFLVYRTSRNV